MTNRIANYPADSWYDQASGENAFEHAQNIGRRLRTLDRRIVRIEQSGQPKPEALRAISKEQAALESVVTDLRMEFSELGQEISRCVLWTRNA